MLKRLSKILTAPVCMLAAKIFPVPYARRLGVKMKGVVTIYGSSYRMFSAEPYLVTLGDNVFISLEAKFICHDGGILPFRRELPDLDLASPITVGSDVFIGMGAVILRGVTIGNRSIVGAYAVVTKDVPDNTIVAGNPARVVGQTDNYLERAVAQSLKIGHLSEFRKHQEYKRIFNV